MTDYRALSHAELAYLGRILIRTTGPIASAVRAEMQRRIDACPTYPSEQPLKIVIVDYGPARPK